MPVCYKCGRKENAMKCACEDCINKPIAEIDKLIRQLDSEKQCVRGQDEKFFDNQIQALLILRGKL
jgi:hypothetical protein